MTAIATLQTKIGVTADGQLGPTTLKTAQLYFKLTKPQMAHFMGQCAHESGIFTVFSENLNYSAAGLLSTFGKYFNQATATQFARQPEKIANHVYANRNGNGDEKSGDGWKFRGRGAIQLTFLSNYQLFADSIHDQSIMTNPDQVADKYAFESAIWFFTHNNLWSSCNTVDDASILAVTKRVNGGTNGLAQRSTLTKKFYSQL